MIKNISNLGDAALYCDFGTEVNKQINSEVIKYFNNIREKNISFIRNTLKISKKFTKSKVLYGGSVNPKNIKNLMRIDNIDGFLIGGASTNEKIFIDIMKKSII